MNKSNKFVCCLCNKIKTGYGNNPEPVMPEFENGQYNRCCDKCNSFVVLPERLAQLYKKKGE